MIIEVTSEDMANGKRNDFYERPIALAFNRQYGDKYGNCLVLHEHFSCHEHWCKLPDEAKKFIVDFDGQKGVSAFKLEMHLQWSPHRSYFSFIWPGRSLLKLS